MKKPKRIKTLLGLALAANKKQSVEVFGKPMPASVLLHMQGATILRALERGLFLYKPKTKPDKEWYQVIKEREL